MFDPGTGTVIYSRVTLRPGQTREEFFAANTEMDVSWVVENQNWSTYQLSPDQKVFFSVSFRSDVIQNVRIAFALDGSDAGAWSAESEAARKSLHDQILREELEAPPYRFHWGRIESLTDLKSGGSEIIVTYA